MDFGLFFLMQRDEQWSEQAVYASGLEQMLAAESLGYHSVWIAEHHFNDYGLCPTPPVLAAFVAARRRPLRPGPEVGVGRGGTLQDYETFQSERADSRARVEEGVALMQRSWSGAPFDFTGRFH